MGNSLLLPVYVVVDTGMNVPSLYQDLVGNVYASMGNLHLTTRRDTTDFITVTLIKLNISISSILSHRASAMVQWRIGALAH
jgi:hypothetical protein